MSHRSRENLDPHFSKKLFEGKTLLITGGTGTFGNAVVDMATEVGFGEIRIFSRDEKKQDDMRNRLKNSAVKFYLRRRAELRQRSCRPCAVWTSSFMRRR